MLSHMKKPATVYFIPLEARETPESLASKTALVLDKAGFREMVSSNKLSAIKQHFGEEGNQGYLRPPIARTLGEMIKRAGGRPLLVETNTLYYGQRSNSYDHLMLAHRHGFTVENLGMPVVIMDGVNGQNQHPVAIPGEHFSEVHLVTDLPFFDSIFVLSHLKGHMAAGMGGTIKNLGMGFSSRAGKLAQHADFKPKFKQSACVRCGHCLSCCPAEAIAFVGEHIGVDVTKCIGCGECYTACASQAVEFDWGGSDRKFQEKMAEYAFGAIIRHPGKAAFLNYFYHVTKQCDCWGKDNPVLFDNVGIFASEDPVAVDKASYDMGIECFGEDIFRKLWPNLDASIQLKHAERIGMGTQEYELVRVTDR